jgi:hypothetical protein
VLSRRSFSRALFLAPLALALAPALPASAQGAEKLFFIQRSKNVDEIHYDARVVDGGKLDPRHPVEGYWLSKTEKGWERSDIKLFQRIAYGFDVEPAPDGTHVMTLKAFPERSLRLLPVGGRWRALTKIGGKRAYLTRLYVATDESGVFPKVLYVDLFGEEEGSGKAIQEHIVKG